MKKKKKKKKKKILKALMVLNNSYLNDLKILNKEIENLKSQLKDFEYRKYLLMLFFHKVNLNLEDFMGFLSQKIVDPYLPDEVKSKIQSLYRELLKRSNSNE